MTPQTGKKMKFMPYRYGIIITFLFFSLLPKARANEVTVVFKNDLNYKGTDDTFIKRGAGFSGGMSNFGACKMMQVNEETRIGLMRFDVSSLFKKYKKIISIKLKLFSKNAPKQGSIQVHRLNIANSAWREGGNCGGTVIGGNRNEVTWMHLVDYGGFPSPPPSWASRTAGPTSPGVDFDEKALGSKKNSESKINEAFEKFSFENGVFKGFFSTCYFDYEQFWNHFSKEKYDKLIYFANFKLIKYCFNIKY